VDGLLAILGPARVQTGHSNFQKNKPIETNYATHPSVIFARLKGALAIPGE
jgi:hypothetical protein